MTIVEEEVGEINHEITSSGQFKGDQGYNSETLEWKRVGAGRLTRGGPVRSKRQRTASGRKRVNSTSCNGPWRMKLPTIYEEGFHSLIDIK